jgi:diguanylate cyclase (GGDEF)-like protein
VIDLVPSVVTSRTSRAFDRGVGLVGSLIGLTATFVMVGTITERQLWHLLTIPVIVVMCWFPMRLGRSAGTFDIGFDPCALVFLSCLLPAPIALSIWAIAQALAQLFTHKRREVRFFNLGIGVLAGAAALGFIEALGIPAETGLLEVLAVAMAAAVYFGVDYGVTAVSIALEERTDLRRQLLQPDAPAALAAFLAVASLGYLAAVMVRQLAPWSALLVTVPVATILVAVRARARGSEQSRRLRVLLATSTSMQTLTDERAVLERLVADARDLLRDPRARLSAVAPGPRDIGAAVPGAASPQWIVAPTADRIGATRDDDHQGLHALAQVAETALSRLDLGTEMTRRAWHDALTGLANRALFLDRLQHATGQRDQPNGRMAVLFCDLDGFKRVNDLAGHVAGDALLVEVARRIAASVRTADTVARLGGDEFAVLLEGLADTAEVESACERILAAVRESFRLADGDVSVSITIGVAVFHSGASADGLLSQADLAMYHAKSRGKNCFETYRPHMGDERCAGSSWWRRCAARSPPGNSRWSTRRCTTCAAVRCTGSSASPAGSATASTFRRTCS